MIQNKNSIHNCVTCKWNEVGVCVNDESVHVADFIIQNGHCEYWEQKLEQIRCEWLETQDEFIFNTIEPFCNQITERKINKKDLEAALKQYYKEKHKDSLTFIEDLFCIFNDNTEYNIRIECEPFLLTVYLEYDPELSYGDHLMIPITYHCAEEFCYINDDKYRKIYHCSDYGIEHHEVILIHKIMNCIEQHKTEITSYLLKCDCGCRQEFALK